MTRSLRIVAAALTVALCGCPPGDAPGSPSPQSPSPTESAPDSDAEPSALPPVDVPDAEAWTEADTALVQEACARCHALPPLCVFASPH